MPQKFLVDSAAFLAVIDARDKHHAPAATFVYNYATANFYLPETVFIETMVLVKSRLGTLPAVELGERLMKSERFIILPWILEVRQSTWQIFSRYTDKDWSYVDCSLLAAARHLQIFNIFTFDRHFDQMPEVIRVPG